MRRSTGEYASLVMLPSYMRSDCSMQGYDKCCIHGKGS